MNPFVDESLIYITDDIVFDVDKFTMLLHIEPPKASLQKMKQQSEKNKLQPKPEFHLTLIGFFAGRKMMESIKDLSKDEKRQVAETIATLASEFTFTYKEKEEYYLIKKQFTPKNRPKETRTSIIQLCEMTDIDNFYTVLNKMFGLSLPAPFPHMTLYTTSTNKKNADAGIGVNSEAEFKQMQPVQLST